MENFIDEGTIKNAISKWDDIKKTFLDEMMAATKDMKPDDFKKGMSDKEKKKVQEKLDKFMLHAKKGNFFRAMTALNKVGKITDMEKLKEEKYMNTNITRKIDKYLNEDISKKDISKGDIIYFPRDENLRLEGVKEKIKKGKLAVSKYKVIDIFKGNGSERIKIAKTSGKKMPHDKYFNDEFIKIVDLSTEYKNSTP